MDQKITKIGIIMVLALALILSSLGALNLGDTFAKEFNVGAANETTVREWGGVSHSKLGASSNQLTAQAATTPPVWDGSVATSFFAVSPTEPGSASNPYLISTGAELAYLADRVSDRNDNHHRALNYKLTADIVLNDTTGWASWNETTKGLHAWPAIGRYGRGFLGVFDGNGHTVSGIYANSADSSMALGLFGRIDGNGTVKNVGVINSYIRGDYVGGVVGYNLGGKVINCYNNGVVTGNNKRGLYAGGVVGENQNGEVINCYNFGAVSGAMPEGAYGGYVGGVVGGSVSNGSTVTNCYNSGAVTVTFTGVDAGKVRVGGVVGYAGDGTISVTNCYNSGAVNATGTTCKGGVVGNIDNGTVTNCYFLKDGAINKDLNAVGSTKNFEDGGTTIGKEANCSAFNAGKQLITAGAVNNDGANGVLVTFEANADLTATLNSGKAQYNKNNEANTNAIKAVSWRDVRNAYPVLGESVTIVGTNIYANGTGITLKAVAGHPELTNIYYKEDLVNAIILTGLTATNGGYNLAGYTVYGGGDATATLGVVAVNGNTSVTMEGGKVTSIYGGGNGANATVTGNTTVTISGGTITGNVVGGGNGATVTGTKIINISGAPTIGAATAGIIMNGGSESNGVDQFVINGALNGSANSINLVIPSGFVFRTVATKYEVLTTDDIAKFALVGDGATSKTLEINGTDKTKLDVVKYIKPLTKPTIGTTSVAYTGKDQANTLKALVTGVTGDMAIAIAPATAIDFGEYTITVSIDQDTCKWVGGGNENLTFKTNITQATNSINNLAIAGWIYGATPNTPTATAAFGTPIFTYSNAVDGAYASNVPTNAGTYWVKASVVGTNNYAAAELTKSFTIAPKNLSEVTIAAITPVTYNAAAHTPTPKVSWTKAGSVEEILNTTSDFTFGYENNTNASNATTKAKVKITAKANSNYTGNKTAEFTINQAQVTLTANSGTMVFGDTPKTDYGYVAAGTIYNNELGAITATTAANNKSNVGNYDITVNFAPKNENYNVTTAGGQLTIARKGVTKPAIAAPQTYSGATIVGINNVVENAGYTINGEWKAANVSTTMGGYLVTFEIGGNYCWGTDTNDIGRVDITWDITPLEATLSWTTPTDLIYDGTPKVPTATVTNLKTQGTTTDSCKVLVELNSGDNINVNVGKFTYKATGLGNPNYKLPELPANCVSGDYTITKRPITITIDDKTSVFGATTAALTWQDADMAIVNSDNLNIVLTKVEGTNVGTYNITGAYNNTNYDVAFKNSTKTQTFGEYTITRKGVTKPTMIATPQTYSGAELTGIEGVASGVGYKIDGDYKATNVKTGSDYSATFTLDGNHCWTTDTTGDTTAVTIAWKILPLATTLEWTAPTNLEYDRTEKVPTVKVSNLASQGATKDTCTVTAVLTNGSNVNVGTFTYTATALDNANYVLSGTLTKDFTITARPITITANPMTKVYGEIDPKLTHTITSGSLVSPDTLTGELSRATGENVNTYAITSTLANPNYKIMFVGANLTITQKALAADMLAIGQVGGEYKGSAYAPTVSVKDGSLTITEASDYTVTWKYTPVSGAVVNPYDSTAAGAFTNAGTYTATLTATNGNYSGSVSKPFTITQKALTVTAVDVATALTKVYDGNTTYSGDIAYGTNYTLNVVGTDEVTLTIGDKNFYSQNVGATKVTINYSAVLGGAAKDNYSIVAGTFENKATITPKNLTVSWTGESGSASDFSWVYRGAEIKPTATVDTGIGADTITLKVSGGQTNVSASAYTATAEMSTPNTNYTLLKTTQDFTITNATLIDTTKDQSYVFDGLEKTFKASADAVGSQPIKYQYGVADGTYADTAISRTNVETITVNYKITAPNHFDFEGSKTFAITKAAMIQFGYPEAPGVTYGATLSTSILNGGSTDLGAFAWTTGAEIPTVVNSGYSVTFTPSDLTLQNYNCNASYTKFIAIAVTPATITTTDFVAYSGAYDKKAHSITAGTPTTVNSQTATIEYSTDNTNWSTTNPAMTDVGTTTVHYKITAPNHTELTGSSTITITKTLNTWKTPLALSKYTWTYGDAAATLTNPVPNFGEAVIEYKSGVNVLLGMPSNAGTYTVTATVAESTNFEKLTATVEFTIDKKALTITGLTAGDKQYDGETTATISGTAVLDGAIATDTAAELALTGTVVGTFANKDTIGSAQNVSLSGLSVTGTSIDNYTFTLPTLSATISKREITVTWEGVATRVYDGNPSNIKATVGNLISSDTCNLVVGNGVGQDATTYTANIVTFDNAKYQMTTPLTCSYEITKRPVTITAKDITSQYKLALAELTCTVTGDGFIAADNITVSLSTDATTESVVGSNYVITPVCVDPNAKLANYTVTINKGKYTIIPQVVENPIPAAQSFIYNGVEQTFVIAANDRYTITGDKQTLANAKYTATVALNEKTNYEWNNGETANGTADLTFDWSIAKATPTLTAPTAAGITYGQALSASGLTGGKATISKGGTAEKIIVNGTFAWSVGTTNPTVENSGYVVTFTPNASDEVNFTAATISTPIAVEKAVLTVTATNQTIIYGDPILQTAYTITGYKLTEDASVVTGIPTLVSSINEVGPGTITVSHDALTAANYSFVSVDGAVTIGQRTITVSPIELTGKSVLTKEYDKNTTYSGVLTKGTHYTLVNALKDDDVDVKFATKVFNDVNVNNANKVTASDTSLSGTMATNYKIATASIELNAKLTKKALTVTPNTAVSIDKNYDGTPNVDKTSLKKDVHYTITGFVVDDNVNITVTAATYADKNVGEGKDVTVTYTLDTDTAVNYSSATSEMKLSGKIIGISAVEGEDFTVTKIGAPDYVPFEKGSTKYFNNSYVITLTGSSVYKTISASETFGDVTTLEVTEECNEFIFYVKKENGEIGQVVLKYGIDRTLPTIDATWTIKDSEKPEVSFDSWFKNNKVTVSIGNILDTGSGINWTDDVNSKTKMTLTKNGVAVAFVKTPNSVSFELNYTGENPINGEYVLTIYDYAGNSVAKTITIDKHDNVAPTIVDTIDGNVIDYTKWVGNGTIDFTLSDATSGIKTKVWTADGIADATVADTFSHKFVNGHHSFKLVVTDNAGNSTTLEKPLLVDNNIATFMTEYNKFDSEATGAEKDKKAAALNALFEGYTVTQKEHITGKDSSNAEADTAYKALQTYITGRKSQIEAERISQETERVKAEITAIMGKNPIPQSDLENFVKQLPISKEVEGKLTPEQKQHIVDIVAVEKVVDLLNAKPNNNAQLENWLKTYNALTETQKTLAQKAVETLAERNTTYVGYKTAVDELIAGAKDLNSVNATNKDKIDALIAKYNALTAVDHLPSGINSKALVPQNVAAKIEKWIASIAKATAVDGKIGAIGGVPTDYTKEFNNKVVDAEKAYNELTADEKTLVANAKTLEDAKKANDELKKKLATSDKAAAEVADFESKFVEFPAKPTIKDVLEIYEKYEKLSTEAKAKLDATTKTNLDAWKTAADAVFGKDDNSKIINRIENIDLKKLENATAEEIATIKAEIESVITEYGKLSGQQKDLVDNTVGGKCDKLADLKARLDAAEKAIKDIPKENADGNHDCGLCNPGSGTGHNTDSHQTLIEKAKIAYEKLSAIERKLLNSDSVTTMETQYEILKDYLSKLAQQKIIKDKADKEDVSVYGLATLVDTSTVPDITIADTIVISVDAKKTDTEMTDMDEDQQKVVSFDVKLMAKAGNNEAVQIQPKENQKVVVKLALGQIYAHEKIQIYHNKNDGSRELVQNVNFIDEGNQTYAIFETSSFSEFFALTEKSNEIYDPDSGSGGSISGGAIFDKSIENEIRYKDTNPVIADVSKHENTLSKSILDAINDAESGKVITVIFKEGEISITKEKLKGIVIDKKSYTYAELKALLEKPEVTPIPTPTPTEKPTEPTEPTEKKCWLCGVCPMFLGLCLWIWLAIAIVVVAVVVVIVVKKKKKDDKNKKE